MERLQRTGGLANWSMQRPVAVVMLSITVLVVGLFAFDRLNINLLPDIIYPNVNIRIIEPGTPATVMEDKFTRQLEEQLAITEDAIRVQSDTSEGRSAVNLVFPYGTDIDRALQDASTRLDRAKRFLPQTAEPPIIYKRDPSQLPVMELVVSSSMRNSIELRSWVDYEFSKWFLNVEGVASTEIGGGLVREIQVIVDQEKLAAAGYKITDIKTLLAQENQDISSGILYMNTRKLSARTEARFESVEAISNLPLSKNILSSSIEDNPGLNSTGLNRSGLNRSGLNNLNQTLLLKDVAQIIDTHQDEELRIRLNQQPGIKLTIQKQPDANTIEVAKRLYQQIEWFKTQNLLPADIKIETVDDQSLYVKRALNNASYAAISGAILAMIIVYIFLRDFRRTLIVATAIPLAIFITFFIMGLNDISLNIMSLGGLALGIGLLVDNTIVMLENISRHQMLGESPDDAASNAAAEVTSAITASTTTNLVAVLPFLFIGGLIGLLFSELIITLSAAIISSLVVALTLIPALGAMTKSPGQADENSLFSTIQKSYKKILNESLKHTPIILIVFCGLLVLSAYQLLNAKNSFFPTMDEGKISISVSTEPGTRLAEFDKTLKQIEELILEQPEVSTVFVSSGGFVFGRSQFQRSNRGTISVQLKTLSERNGISSINWIKKTSKQVKALQLAGFKVRMRVKGVRGVHTSHGDDDFSLRIQGDSLEKLTQIAETIIEKISVIPELKNLSHSYEEQDNELIIKVNRQRAADLNITAEDIGLSVQLALNGQVATEYLEGDREFDIRIRLKREKIRQIQDIKNIIISLRNNEVIRLFDVASITIEPAPSSIKRDNQLRINEISASIDSSVDYKQLMEKVFDIVNTIPMEDGYIVYDGGTLDALKESSSTSYILLALAVFLVFVVMTVQYESLTNPLIIILGVPFTLIGVYLAVEIALNNQLSMPAKLGIIMLAGIVVNNAIVLVEQIETCRQQGLKKLEAVLVASTLRLRPILMTSLTSVFGMLPLALGLNEGSEMLKPLATVIVFGLSFSLLVSLIVIPMLYLLVHKKENLA